MHRIDTPGNQAGQFVPPNVLTGQPPVKVDSAWLNDVQETLANPIEASGAALQKGVFNQLTTAINTLIGNAVTALKAAANNWTLLQTFTAGISTTSIAGMTTPLSVAQGGTGAATAAAARTALGVGTAGTQATGTSGATVPLLNGANTWSAAQTFSGGLSGTLTGNVTGSSGSCTGNAASATTAASCSGNAASATTAASCTGNAASATTAASCSGNAATATHAGDAGTVGGKTVNAGTFFVAANSDASATYATPYDGPVIPVFSPQYGAGGEPNISNPLYVTTYSATGFTVHNPTAYSLTISWIAIA